MVGIDDSLAPPATKSATATPTIYYYYPANASSKFMGEVAELVVSSTVFSVTHTEY
jgi:hypothetical protein